MGLPRTADGQAPVTGRRPSAADQTSSVAATALRFARLCLHFLSGWIELVLVFPRLRAEQRAQRVQVWCARFLRIAKLEVQSRGALPAQGPVLLVANHVSWLDMVVIQSLRQTRFVAKSEVQDWPVIGTMATRCGTVYIERKRLRSTAEAAARITGLLRAGETLTLFPEGTTSNGSAVQKFHSSLLQAPIDAAVAVQPLSLTYLEAVTGAACSRVAYAGDDTLLHSMWRTLRRPTLVRARFGEALDANWRDRRELASELQRVIVSLQETDTDRPGDRCRN